MKRLLLLPALARLPVSGRRHKELLLFNWSNTRRPSC